MRGQGGRGNENILPGGVINCFLDLENALK